MPPSKYPLSIREMIMVHLYRYKEFRKCGKVPFALCQQGIGEALGIKQPQVAKNIKELKMEGNIIEKRAVVMEIESKRKVYFLSARGQKRAKKLVETLCTNVYDYLGVSENVRYFDLVLNALWQNFKKAASTDRIIPVAARLMPYMLLNPDSRLFDVVKAVKGAGSEGEEGCEKFRHRDLGHADNVCQILGLVYARLGLWESAAREFERWAKMAPKNALANFNHGLVLEVIGNYEEGVKRMDAAARLFKKQNNSTMYGVALLILSRMYSALGEKEKAAKLSKKAEKFLYRFRQ